MQKFCILIPFFFRHLRLAELLQEHSTDAEMIVMYAFLHRFPTKLLESGIDLNFLAGRTLPMPRRDAQSAALYLSWLEMITREAKAPFLLVRGNQVRG